MFNLAKLAIVYLIAVERVWTPPQPVQDHPIFRKLTAQVAQDLELFLYPECGSLEKARDAYDQARYCRVKLDDAKRFFFINFGTDNTCYMVWILKYNRPFDSVCQKRIDSGCAETKAIWSAIKRDNDLIYRVYDLLDDINRPLPLYVKRQKLEALKDLLGEELYEKGWLPPLIPTWWFIPPEENLAFRKEGKK